MINLLRLALSMTPSFQRYLDAMDEAIGRIEDGSLAAQPHITYAPM